MMIMKSDNIFHDLVSERRDDGRKLTGAGFEIELDLFGGRFGCLEVINGHRLVRSVDVDGGVWIADRN
jgi:hypothetical protein